MQQIALCFAFFIEISFPSELAKSELRLMTSELRFTTVRQILLNSTANRTDMITQRIRNIFGSIKLLSCTTGKLWQNALKVARFEASEQSLP